MPDIIKLPSERVEQLRQLSEARSMSIADLIGEYVQQQIASGALADDIPGINVRRKGKSVELDFGDFKKTYSLPLAGAVVNSIRWLAKPRSPGMQSALADVAATVGGFDQIGLSKQGPAIRISEGSKSRTLAPAIANELADLIERTANS
jgi:hypothetical protein